jgi:hypothetical protein
MDRRRRNEIKREETWKRAAELLAKQVDTVFASEAMAVLQETMGHFYYKAKVLKTLGADAPFEEIDDLMEKAAKWAEKIGAFKYAKIQAMRLATEPNAPVLPEHMTLDELRESIMVDIERLRERGVMSLPKREVNGNESEGDPTYAVAPEPLKALPQVISKASGPP